ncbi:MAG: cupredoxin domain-containing protein [Nitrososphaeraceae archaeon]
MRRIVVYSIVSLVLMTGLTNSQSIFAEKKRVSISEGAADRETDEYYVPDELKVKKGTTVVWTNDDTTLHTVTSGHSYNGTNGFFDSGFLAPGDKFEFTFTKSGNYYDAYYNYFCTLHPYMSGLVKVSPTASYYDDYDRKKPTVKSDYNNNGINWKELCDMAQGIISESCRDLVKKNNPYELTKEGERVLGCLLGGGALLLYPQLAPLAPLGNEALDCKNNKNIDVVGNLLSEFLGK